MLRIVIQAALVELRDTLTDGCLAKIIFMGTQQLRQVYLHTAHNLKVKKARRHCCLYNNA